MKVIYNFNPFWNADNTIVQMNYNYIKEIVFHNMPAERFLNSNQPAIVAVWRIKLKTNLPG